jgi:osmotically inducible protein OsmC
MSPLQPLPATLLDKYRGQGFQALYSATVTVTGSEAGHEPATRVARSEDGGLLFDLRLPAELGGPGGATNPEQLLAASYAACFHGVLNLLASKEGLWIPDAAVTVSVAFGRDPVDGFYMLAADVKIALPGMDQAVARELVRNAERVCPYAKMARQGMVSVVALAL